MAKIFKNDPDASHDVVHPASNQGKWAGYGVAPSVNDTSSAADNVTTLLNSPSQMDAANNSRLIGPCNEQVTYVELRIKYPVAARGNITQQCKVKLMGFDSNGNFQKLIEDGGQTDVELTLATDDEVKGLFAYGVPKRWDKRGCAYVLPVITQALQASSGLNGSEDIEFIGY
jgi:hypothetical protein